MIDSFTKQNLISLVQQQNDPCVTIYLPTRKTGREIYEPVSRLKKLADLALQKLTNTWMGESDAENFLAPIHELTEDNQSWQETDLGLALFLNADSLQCWRVARSFPEQVFVSRQFFVRPMLMLIGSNEPFYILALSRNKAELFEANSTTIDKLEVQGLPQGLEDALNVSSVDRGAQSHTGSRELGGKAARVFHGQDVKHESAKGDLLQYFKLVNEAIGNYLRDNHRPMVLACVAEHSSKYRSINSCPDLLESTACGNFDRQSKSQLLEKSLPIVKQQMVVLRQSAIKAWRESANTTRSVSETRELVAAAYNGRVDKLLVNENASIPGEFSIDRQTIRYTDKSDGFDADLVEDAIAQTLLHRGEVHGLTEGEMPTEQPMVATLRY